MTPTDLKPARVAITGAYGNLGRKLTAHLLATDWCRQVLAIDRAVPAEAGGREDVRVVPVMADLADAGDVRWREALSQADAVVHLAAQNPYPEASWEDGVASIDMTANLAFAAAAAGVRRFVFATSNHVMGGYKDAPLAGAVPAGGLTTALPPSPGTRYFDGRRFIEEKAYAVAKLTGERLLAAAAAQSGGALTCVSVRIGWCQPGENHPRTITAAGTPTAEGEDPALAGDLLWFRGMWLSNADFAAVMACALTADAAAWPGPAVVVNAMSGNRGMKWDIETTRRLIGYVPRDDVWASLGLTPPV